MQKLGAPERRDCTHVVGAGPRSARRREAGPYELRRTVDIIERADQYGRSGYRTIASLRNNAGWHVNHRRVERILRREGLQSPQKQKSKGRL